MEEFKIGQRWISETEPELGLGSVLNADSRFVEILFPASNNKRRYSSKNAPLKRVRFKIGDQVKSHNGEIFTVESLTEENGLLIYQSKAGELSETELSSLISFTNPEERLFSGQSDENYVFNLRYETLLHQSRIRKSGVKGLVGPRVDLIPHQLYIAREVASRYAPRVLLADDVGLGKTIEAGLIMHQLLLSERVSRVLIVIPETLTHQWYVEMLRRFNLAFNIFDEDRCQAIEENNPDINPFLDNQLIICCLQFILSSKIRQQQLISAGWDLMAVDEAHHLIWTSEKASPEYLIIDQLARLTPAVLLLTATPEQLGKSSHFARLRLLDPDRFYDLKAFIDESEQYTKVAGVVEHLISGEILNEQDQDLLKNFLHNAANPNADIDSVARLVLLNINKINSGDLQERKEIIDALIDQHGTGRILFRNTRSVLQTFPKRIAYPAQLKNNAEDPVNPQQWWKSDPRINWLANLLKILKNEKVLLICSSKKTVLELEEAIKAKIKLKTAVFHEDLSLIARDRNAAYFSEPEGASILICSEIGSEGRNFQFASHLVLFDLTLNPDLLEQRIGRLDRIGQQKDIKIHIPYIENSAQEILFEIYHSGLNAFETSPRGSITVFGQFAAIISEAVLNPSDFLGKNQTALENLVNDIRAYSNEVGQILDQGRDRLLEFNSYRPETGKAIAGQIAEIDRDKSLELYMDKVFEHFGISVDDIGDDYYFISPGDRMFTDAFPYLKEDGMTVTYNRNRALEREDMEFLTWEHPMITGAIDLLLGSEHGNSSLVVLAGAKEKGPLLEAVYILECVAPKELEADRFLPPTPIRVIINSSLKEVKIDLANIKDKISDVKAGSLNEMEDLNQTLLQTMLDKSKKIAEAKIAGIISENVENMVNTLSYEAKRLIALHAVNPNVNEEEIEFSRDRIAALHSYLQESRLRLDSLRLMITSV